MAFVVALAILPVISYFNIEHPTLLLGFAFFYLVTAFVLQSRVIICTLGGVLLGCIFDSGVKSGGIEYQVWEMIWNISLGVGIGIISGIVWDNWSNIEPAGDALEKPHGPEVPFH